jgi:hypothetical protein
MLSEGTRVGDTVTIGGQRARGSAVTQPTLRPHIVVEESPRSRVARLAVALVGLGLFAASFATFRLTESPPEGTWALLLEAAGWVGMLAAARIVTDRWLAPSLVISAWLLLVMSNAFGARLIERGTDKGLALGFNYVTALITLEAGAWVLVGLLMLDGAARLWREDAQRSQSAVAS